MLERAVRGALMNSLSFMWGFRSPVSGDQHRQASPRAILYAQEYAVASEPGSRFGRSGGRGMGVHCAPGAGENHIDRGRGPRYAGCMAGQASAGGHVQLWQILINGNDIREFDPAELQRRFSVVFQDCVRYALTARENVGFGDVRHVDDAQRVRGAAAAAAGVAEDLAALPQGYETFLGGQFGIGRDLSGGQWQKVGLARGFMRRGPLFILDEPTVHLDALAEFAMRGDAGTDRPGRVDVARISDLAGQRAVGFRHAARGYTPAERWIVALADGSSVFAKIGVDSLTAEGLRTEQRVYGALQGDFMAQVRAWDDGERPLLLLEDLSACRWPPPWDATGVDRVMAALASLRAADPGDASAAERRRSRCRRELAAGGGGAGAVSVLGSGILALGAR